LAGQVATGPLPAGRRCGAAATNCCRLSRKAALLGLAAGQAEYGQNGGAGRQRHIPTSRADTAPISANHHSPRNSLRCVCSLRRSHDHQGRNQPDLRRRGSNSDAVLARRSLRPNVDAPLNEPGAHSPRVGRNRFSHKAAVKAPPLVAAGVVVVIRPGPEAGRRRQRCGFTTSAKTTTPQDETALTHERAPPAASPAVPRAPSRARRGATSSPNVRSLCVPNSLRMPSRPTRVGGP
jgi:hypothetical protein